MRRYLYYKKNKKNRLIFVFLVILILLIELKISFLLLGLFILLTIILSYHFLLKNDFRISIDDQNLYFDNLFSSKIVPLDLIIKVERNRWNFTSTGTGGPSEYGYKVFYSIDGVIEYRNVLIDSDHVEEWEKNFVVEKEN